jgi:hypothetical protein
LSGFQLKLTGPGLTLDKEITEDLANHITMLVVTGGKAETAFKGAGAGGGNGPGGAGGSGNPTDTGVKGKSAREYLLSVPQAKKHPQQMTVIGHYLTETTGNDGFTLEDLKSGFDKAKEPVPKNPNRDLAAAIKRGWIASKSDDDKSLYVTSSGLSAIQTGFPKGKRQRKNKKKKASAAKAK